MKKLLILTVALASVSVMASSVARVAIDGRKAGIKLIPGTQTAGCALSNPGWVKPEEQSKQMIYFACPKLKQDKWQEAEFTFTPTKSGKIRLFIRAEWSNIKKGAKPYYVYFKAVKILEGATLKNPDFSEHNDQGALSGWSFYAKSKDKPTILQDKDGATIVKLSFSGALNQYIEVIKDKLVRIKIKVKSAMPSDKK